MLDFQCKQRIVWPMRERDSPELLKLQRADARSARELMQTRTVSYQSYTAKVDDRCTLLPPRSALERRKLRCSGEGTPRTGWSGYLGVLPSTQAPSPPSDPVCPTGTSLVVACQGAAVAVCLRFPFPWDVVLFAKRLAEPHPTTPFLSRTLVLRFREARCER